eukprot:18691-Eustigmatos_ZCMA.PRE.1
MTPLRLKPGTPLLVKEGDEFQSAYCVRQFSDHAALIEMIEDGHNIRKAVELKTIYTFRNGVPRCVLEEKKVKQMIKPPVDKKYGRRKVRE